MWRYGRRDDDRGATLVEFALIAPILFMLLFGIITGGLAYNRSLAISHSADQTSRYAATLPLDTYPSVDKWLDAVHERVMATSEGELSPSTQGRSICVAWVGADAEGVQATRRRMEGDSGGAKYSSEPCWNDGLGNDERRVQVWLSRPDRIELIVSDVDVTLSRKVVARSEVTS